MLCVDAELGEEQARDQRVEVLDQGTEERRAVCAQAAAATRLGGARAALKRGQTAGSKILTAVPCTATTATDRRKSRRLQPLAHSEHNHPGQYLRESSERARSDESSAIGIVAVGNLDSTAEARRTVARLDVARDLVEMRCALARRAHS